MGEAKLRKINFQTTRLSSGSDCLNCGIKVDAATSIDHRHVPHEGAIAICLICSHIMAYDETVHLRELTDEEVIDIAGRPEILFAINRLGSAKAAWESKHGEGSWGASSRQRLKEARAKIEQDQEKAQRG